MLRVEALSTAEALAAVGPEWEALETQVFPRTPFASALWNRLWWQHFQRRLPWCRDQLFAQAVRDEQGALVAIAPMMLTSRPAVGPGRLRQLQFFGADQNLTELRGPVCRPEDEDAVVEALRANLMRRERDWDWWQWSGLRAGGAGQRQLERAEPDGGLRASDCERQVPNYFLRLPASWEQFRGERTRNVKESLRKCYNSLRREGHQFRLRVAETAEPLSRFYALHRARALAPMRIAHPDYFAAPRNRRFLEDYAVQMAARGALRIFELEVGGQVCASRIGFLLGDELYLYYSGYEPAWARYSVMTTLFAEIVRWSIGERLRIVNLSTGADRSKLRWSPESVVHVQGTLQAAGLRSRAAFQAYGSARRALSTPLL